MLKVQRLLKLIEEGDADRILNERKLVSKLNFLLDKELIYIEDDKLSLTEKGVRAKNKGLKSVLKTGDWRGIQRNTAAPTKLFLALGFFIVLILFLIVLFLNF